MSGIRMRLIVLVLITVCALQIAAWQGNQPAASSSGPAFGKWNFTAKESTGVVWTGTLTVSKLDTNRFDAGKYHSLCNIEAVSTKGGLGVEHPAKYDPSTRTFSFGEEGNWGGSTYTAVLSANDKKLDKGKWRQSDRDFDSKKLVVVASGDWSAELIGK